eukprot:6209805-Pleurochrysis_carterae.AAC.1
MGSCVCEWRAHTRVSVCVRVCVDVGILARGGCSRLRSLCVSVQETTLDASFEIAVGRDLFDLCEFPLSVAERADGARLEPTRDAVEMEDVAAASPRDR